MPAVRPLIVALAVVACGAPRGAVADVFAGEPRASTVISGHYVTESLPAVLVAIGKQTGLPLSVEGVAPDVPITLIFHERRAADVLSAVASFLDFTWVRQPKAYVLTWSPEQEANGKRELREVLAPLPTLIHAFATKKAGSEPSDPLVRDISRLGYKILREIGTAGIARLMEADDALFVWPARAGCLEVPDNALQEWRSEPVNVAQGDWDPRRATCIAMRCTLSLAYMTPSLECRIWAWAYEPSKVTGAPTLRSVFGLAGGIDYSTYVAPLISGSGRRVGSERPDWLADEVTIELTDTVDFGRSEPVFGQPRTYLLGDALAELDRTRGVNVLADAFAAPQMFGMHVRGRSMADALDELARHTTSEWWVESGFLMMRHQQRTLRRASEPPHQLIRDLRRKLERNEWTLSESAQLATLPTPRFESIWFPANPPLLPHALHLQAFERDALRLWQALTPAQRATAEDAGVAYAALSATQRAMFRRFVNALDSPTAATRDVQTEDQIIGAILRVTLQPGQAFRHRRGGWTMAGGSRELALAQFRLYDAATTEADLIVGSRPWAWLRITNGEKVLNSASIAMPIVWPE